MTIQVVKDPQLNSMFIKNLIGHKFPSNKIFLAFDYLIPKIIQYQVSIIQYP